MEGLALAKRKVRSSNKRKVRYIVKRQTKSTKKGRPGERRKALAASSSRGNSMSAKGEGVSEKAGRKGRSIAVKKPGSRFRGWFRQEKVVEEERSKIGAPIRKTKKFPGQMEFAKDTQ